LAAVGALVVTQGHRKAVDLEVEHLPVKERLVEPVGKDLAVVRAQQAVVVVLRKSVSTERVAFLETAATA
jgi:hypothetical protein